MIPRATLGDVRSSRLVPFVGAGVSRNLLRADGKDAFPSWFEFLEIGRTKLSSVAATACQKAIAERRYVEAAEVIKDNLSLSAWYRLLRRSFGLSYDDLLPESLDLAKAIWRCARGLVVTTNYDSSLAWAVPDAVQRKLRTFGLEAPLNLSTVLQSDPDHPILWHLHGRIDFPSSVVIAPDGYGRLYGDDPAVPKRFIQAIFALRHLIATHSLMFVGFSLTDANVVAELQHIHQLFDESEHSHFVLVRTADVPDIERRIGDAGLRNLELLEVEDFGAPLLDQLAAIAASIPSTRRPPVPRRPVDPTKRPHLRRRCRSVLVGSAAFRTRVGPCIAEHQQQDHATVLVEALADARSRVERKIAQTVLHELNGAIELMVTSSSPTGLTGAAWANLAIFHAIGLEKLNRLEAAIALNDQVIANARLPEELRLCAAFNREVCLEKAGDPGASFEVWLEDRTLGLSTGELVWPKAFSMELIACSKQGRQFPYASLLDEAITAEITKATTGFGKTILNWAHHSQVSLDTSTISEVWRVASHASVNVRVAMLGDLWAVTDDETLGAAIMDALDASAAVSRQSETVLRVLSRLPDHGR